MGENTKQLFMVLVASVCTIITIVTGYYMVRKLYIDNGAVWCNTEKNDYPQLVDPSSCINRL